MDLSELSKSDLAAKLQSARARFASMKVQGERVMQISANTGFAVGGGALAGVLMVKMPKVPGTEIPSHLALGLALTALGVAQAAGQWSDELAALGSGMLAADAAQRTAAALQAA